MRETTTTWPRQLALLPYKEAKRRVLRAFDRFYYDTATELAGGNKSEAARRAGLDIANFRRVGRRTR